MNRFMLKRLAAAVLLALALSTPALADRLAMAEATDQDNATLTYLDGSTATANAVMPGGEVRLSAEQGKTITGLYLVWDIHPGSYEVTTSGGVQSVGKDGFLHEYIPLDHPAQTLVLSGWQGAGRLCEAALLDSGELPDFVQVWQPPCTEADLLLLPTHADDELLFFGGTMPYYAGGQGKKVQVAYLTNHHTELYREHERLNGLWTAGIRHYPVVGPFADVYSETLEQAEGQYNVADVEAWQVEQLRRFQPLAVVGHDLGGEYGHGAHMLGALCLTRAVEAAADPQQNPSSAEIYGAWDTPKTYLHLYDQRPIQMDWSQPLEVFGGRSSYQVAVDAFACHSSQQSFQMGGSGVYDCTRFGLYRTTVGDDMNGGDFLENTSKARPAPEPEVITPAPESQEVPELEPTPDPTPQRPALEELISSPFAWAALGIVALALVVLAVYLLRRP